MWFHPRSLLAAILSTILAVVAIAGAASAQVAPRTTMDQLVRLQIVTDATTLGRVGDKINVTATATNISNTTLRNIDVTIREKNNNGFLCTNGKRDVAANESVSCSMQYTITSSDVYQGSVRFWSTSWVTQSVNSGTGTVDVYESVTSDDWKLDSQITLSPKGYFSAGDQIAVGVEVFNPTSRPISLTSLYVYASGPGSWSQSCQPEKYFEPQAKVMCNFTYTVTDADVRAGKIRFTSTRHGTTASGGTIYSSDEAVASMAKPSINLDQRVLSGQVASAGQTVSVELTGRNTGDLPLTDVGFGGISQGCPATDRLEPGDAATCVLEHKVTQKELDGAVADLGRATVTGTPDLGVRGRATTAVSATSLVLVDLTKSQAPEVEFAVAADRAIAAVGEDVRFTVTARNSGNLTLTAAAFSGTDSMAGLGCSPLLVPIAPGEGAGCSVAYTVTEADLANGEITGSASLQATAANGARFTPEGTAQVVVVGAPAGEGVGSEGLPMPSLDADDAPAGEGAGPAGLPMPELDSEEAETEGDLPTTGATRTAALLGATLVVAGGLAVYARRRNA